MHRIRAFVRTRGLWKASSRAWPHLKSFLPSLCIDITGKAQRACRPVAAMSMEEHRGGSLQMDDEENSGAISMSEVNQALQGWSWRYGGIAIIWTCMYADTVPHVYDCNRGPG